MVETMFYDKWVPSGKSSISKPTGTYVPRWEDIQDDPEPDLSELLLRKKNEKRHQLWSQIVRHDASGFKHLMTVSYINYEGVQGLPVARKGVLEKYRSC